LWTVAGSIRRAINEAPMSSPTTGSAAQIARSTSPFPAVTGGARTLLRLEGLAVGAAALALYAHAGFSWPLFGLFILAPDLAMLAYLGGPRTGAIGYNAAHTHVLAVPLTLAGYFGGMPLAAMAGLIWLAHIGFDRALGYGLKYPTGFSDTHLGRIGRH
jgi:hypothetical protein